MTRSLNPSVKGIKEISIYTESNFPWRDKILEAGQNTQLLKLLRLSSVILRKILIVTKKIIHRRGQKPRKKMELL